MSWNRTATDAQVLEAYRAGGSCKAAGKALGIGGQAIHKRLKRMGADISVRRVTDADRDAVREHYTCADDADFDSSGLAARLGLSPVTISRVARSMGLTRVGRPHNADTVAKLKARDLWASRPHPRGMAGKKHTAETLGKVADASRRMWATHKAFGIGQMSDEARRRRQETMARIAAARPAESNHTRAAGGRRPDLGETFFRSRWEANYARYLNLLIRLGVVVSWEYEPETFWFEGIRRGVTSYKPDFRVLYKGESKPVYVEIKGWVTAKDRTKWKRMAKYHPEIKLEIVAEKQYRALAKKWASAIPNWETQTRGRSVPLTEDAA
jgi:hypothetical protein